MGANGYPARADLGLGNPASACCWLPLPGPEPWCPSELTWWENWCALGTLWLPGYPPRRPAGLYRLLCWSSINADLPLWETGVLEALSPPVPPGGPGVTEPRPEWWRCCSMSDPPPPPPLPPPPPVPPPPPPDGPPPDMLFGVGVLDGQGSPAPNGLPRSVKLSVVVLPGRSTLDATKSHPATRASPPKSSTRHGARILGPGIRSGQRSPIYWVRWQHVGLPSTTHTTTATSSQFQISPQLRKFQFPDFKYCLSGSTIQYAVSETIQLTTNTVHTSHTRCVASHSIVPGWWSSNIQKLGPRQVSSNAAAISTH